MLGRVRQTEEREQSLTEQMMSMSAQLLLREDAARAMQVSLARASAHALPPSLPPSLPLPLPSSLPPSLPLPLLPAPSSSFNNPSTGKLLEGCASLTLPTATSGMQGKPQQCSHFAFGQLTIDQLSSRCNAAEQDRDRLRVTASLLEEQVPGASVGERREEGCMGKGARERLSRISDLQGI